jgi:ribosome-associated translation inhibitor RaiA
MKMHHQITGDNLKITEEIKELINKHLIEPLDKLLQDFQEDVKFPTIKVSKKVPPGPPGYIINFDMWLPEKNHIYAEETDKLLIKCITKLREDVEIQIKKYRGEIKPYL